MMSNTERPQIAKQIYRRTLPNGLEIFICPRPGTGTVFTQAVVKTGSIHEGRFLGCGLSHFLEHMVFSGTEHYPGHTDIADRVNKLGGRLNASTGYSTTQYYMELPAAAAAEGVDMIYDMIANPLFPQERFLHEKDVILRECAMRDDRPATAVYEKFLASAFRKHPLRVPIIGYGEKIATVDREIMRAYYEERYSPARTAFVVAGDVDPVQMADHIEKTASSWRMGRIDDPILTPEPMQNMLRQAQTFYNDPFAWVIAGWREPGSGHRDEVALEVFNKLVGGSESSRLVTELQTKRKLADEISAERIVAEDAASGFIFAVTDPAKTDAMLDGIHEILDELKHKSVEQSELDRIHVAVERVFWDILRTNSGLGRFVSRKFAAGEDMESIDSYAEMIRAVSPDDIMRIAREYRTGTQETIVTQLPETFKGKSQVSVSALRSKGRPEVHTFPAGQKGIFLEGDDSLPLVALNFMFPGGNHFEPEKLAGAASLLTSMLPAGTKTYPEEEFERVLNDHAITLDVDDSGDHFYVRAECMAHQTDLLKDLLKSMFSEPLFDPERFEFERDFLIRELESELVDPRLKALELTRSRIFGTDHPCGYTNEQIIKNLETISIDDVKNFYRRACIPEKTVVSVGGAISRADGEKLLTDIFSAIPWSNDPLPEPENAEVCGREDLFLAEKLEKAQSVVMYGFPIPAAKDLSQEERMIFRASNGMASRLFKTVREERGLAYYTQLMPAIRAYTGWAAYLAGTAAGAEEEVLQLFEEERKLRSTEGFSADEFNDAVAGERFEILDHMQDICKLSAICCRMEYCGRGADAIWRALENLQNITLDSFNDAAKKFFKMPFRVMTAVSPEKISKFPEIPD